MKIAAGLGLGGLLAGIALLLLPPAGASSISATFAKDRVAVPGTAIALGHLNVPEGQRCVVTMTVDNQPGDPNASVRVGTAVQAFTAGGLIATASDVEATQGKHTVASGSAVAGPTIEVVAIAGDWEGPRIEFDGISISVDVTATCEPVATTTQPPVVTTQPAAQPASAASIAHTPAEIGHGPEHTG